MATTPKTVRTYPINSVTKDFTIPFEYLARKFVVVTLIGATRRELILNTEYRFTTPTTITTTKAWGPSDNFTLIEIRRLTSASERLVDFADGSILRAYDLNISSVQSLHIAEEARDLTADTIGVNNDGNLDARARKIVNLADGTEDGDAVNLRQQKQWAGSALNQAQAAAASAQAAAQSAAAALAQAQNSAGSASASLTSAQNSAGSASASQTARTGSEAARDASVAARDLAQAWASKAEDSLVASGLYSSYHYSRKSAASAADSLTSATNSAGSAGFATTEANRATTQADRAKTEADKLGNMNLLGGALDSVTGTKVIWKGQQVSKQGGFLAYQASGGEATFGLGAADGTDQIRLTRTSARVVYLYDDANGALQSWTATGTTINKALTLGAGLTVASAATFNGNVTAAALIVNNASQFKGGNVQIYSPTQGANTHVWYYGTDGTTRGILYAGDDKVMRMQAGAGLVQTWSPDGSSSFAGTVGVGNGLSVYSPSIQTIFYKAGVGIAAAMYGNCQLQLQAQDGGIAALGFHSAGKYASSIYLDTNNQFAAMRNSGSASYFVTQDWFMTTMAQVLTADILGSISMHQNVSGTNLGLNSVLGGGNLRYSSHNNVSGTAPSGSWRSLGNANAGGVSLWVRYA